jgi:ABC-type multidrug transport system ATPase subunit
MAIKNFLKGKTIIFATHLINLAFESDYVIIFEKGKIKSQGFPKDLYEEIQRETNVIF